MTEYLSKVSGQWKSGPGKGVAVDWPTGVGARGRGVPSTEWGLAVAIGGRTSIAGNTRRKLLASGRSGARARPNGSVTTVEPGPIS